MISVRINNKKDFMAQLLKGNLFDSFLLEEATIETFNTFTIDGRIHKEFYSEEELTGLNTYSKWSDVKPICFDLIKGKHTPLGFKFVLHASDSLKEALIKQADFGISPESINLGANIRFSNGDIIITTGISYSIFTMDKSIEKAWDNYIPSFLESSEYNLNTEIL